MMDRDPGDFAQRGDEELSRSDEESRLDMLLAGLPHCPGLPETPEEIAASDARALADVAAGRVHSHEVVGEWLMTWGTPDRRPFKEWLAARNG